MFLAAVIILAFRQRPWFQFPLLGLSLILGAYIPDADHLLYWFFRAPELAESQQALLFWRQRRWRSLMAQIKSHADSHTNLIFHHFFGHTIITLLSFFIFTSTSGIFTQGLILAINLHLFLNVYTDWRQRPTHLQSWLFAREPKQLPLTHLKYYVYIFLTCNLLYISLFFSNL